jgi:hypothetical protein
MAGCRSKQGAVADVSLNRAIVAKAGAVVFASAYADRRIRKALSMVETYEGVGGLFYACDPEKHGGKHGHSQQ